jgi:hypothetical protein
VYIDAKTVTIGVLTLTNSFITYFHAFLIISNLTKHLKINSIIFMNLMIVSDFIQIQGTQMGHSAKVEYFSKQE